MRNDKKKQQLNTHKIYRSACVIILYHDFTNFYFQRTEKLTWLHLTKEFQTFINQKQTKKLQP